MDSVEHINALQKVGQDAPFWFDVLNKFMVIRSTIKPVEKSGEQPSRDKPTPKGEVQPAGATKD